MEFVNFKIAKLLKEAGFDEPCFGFYYEKPHPSFNHEEMLVLYKADREQTDYTANLKSFKQNFISTVNTPTTEQAIDWLAKNKQIYIDIVTAPTFASKTKVGYIWQIKRDSDGSTVSIEESQEMFINKSECKINAIEFALTLI